MSHEDLSPAERDMIHRLDFAAHFSGVAGVTGRRRREALMSLARRGLAECWEGEGRDAGVLLGRLTHAGRRLQLPGRARPVEAAS